MSIENILIQTDIVIKEDAAYNLFNEIIQLLNTNTVRSAEVIIKFLTDLNTAEQNDNYSDTKTIFQEIGTIVKEYKEGQMNFQTAKFKHKNFIGDNTKNQTLFGKYQLFLKESNQNYITIDPTIIQILIFDGNIEEEDIVYSLKLIIRDKKKLTLRYTTKLFPNKIMDDKTIESKITTYDNLTDFIDFNKNLNTTFFSDFENKLSNFMKTYIKFYEFYKKCYKIHERYYTDYQLKYISILGKARFRNKDIIKRTALLTDYVMSNLLFTSPAYGFISGGYKGFKDSAYGITRSGYEIAKKYNRPILTIMCKEGMHDSHEYSDATLIYGEHWGEDTIALSQLTDGAIIIAPFGGWTYVECLALLEQKKIVGIYNDLFNILNYEKKMNSAELKEKAEKSYAEILNDEEKAKLVDIYDSVINEEIAMLTNINTNKNTNKNFFNFTISEQNSIIDYYINYYLILLRIIIIAKLMNKADNKIKISEIDVDFTSIETKYTNLKLNFEHDYIIKLEKLINIKLEDCLILGIQILSHLKILFTAGQICLIEDGGTYVSEFAILLDAFNKIKTKINSNVNAHLDTINYIYAYMCIDNPDTKYQIKIPKKCDGIWIKPAFDLINNCVNQTAKAVETASIIALKGISAKSTAEEKANAASRSQKEKDEMDSENLRLLNEYRFNASNAAFSENAVGSGKSKSKSKSRSRSRSRRSGGMCNSTDVSDSSLLNTIQQYKINYEELMKHKIFKRLNTNIIFVFSDILYLTSYLNTNLNISNFQENMGKKITKLSRIYDKKSKNSLFASSFKLLTKEKIDSVTSITAQDDSDKLIDLNRSIDGMYSPDREEIIHHHVIKEKYSFIIDNTTCNNLLMREHAQLQHPSTAHGGSKKKKLNK